MRQNIFVVVFLAFAGLVSAQVNKSNLTGIVRDGTGAAIPGVTIKLASVGTGAVRTETSDTSGFYRFTLIDRGVYRLEAEHAGFKQFRQDSVELQTGETTTNRYRAHTRRSRRKCHGVKRGCGPANRNRRARHHHQHTGAE